MSTPKKTKFRAIIEFEQATKLMLEMGFTQAEIKEIIRDILRANQPKKV